MPPAVQPRVPSQPGPASPEPAKQSRTAAARASAAEATSFRQELLRQRKEKVRSGDVAEPGKGGAKSSGSNRGRRNRGGGAKPQAAGASEDGVVAKASRRAVKPAAKDEVAAPDGAGGAGAGRADEHDAAHDSRESEPIGETAAAGIIVLPSEPVQVIESPVTSDAEGVPRARGSTASRLAATALQAEDASPDGEAPAGARDPGTGPIDLSALPELQAGEASDNQTVQSQGGRPGQRTGVGLGMSNPVDAPGAAPDDSGGEGAAPDGGQGEPGERAWMNQVGAALAGTPDGSAPEGSADPAAQSARAGMIDPSAPAAIDFSFKPSGPAGAGAAFAAASPDDATPPEARFAAANHENIVKGMRAEVLPNGGTMRIRLDPPQLGALQVTVEIRDGVVTAAFETSNDDATRLLGHSLNQLKSVLESHGVAVDKLQVQQSPRDERPAGPRDDPGQNRGQTPHDQEQAARQEQQRKEMLRRMWRQLAGGDPLDVTV